LSIFLISLLLMGTSLTQYIFKVGPWSIFLIVPEVDLKTERVTIWSSRIGSGMWPAFFKEKVSKVEKPDD